MNWRRCFGAAGYRSLIEAYRACPPEGRSLCPEFFERYPKGRGTGTLTPFAGIDAHRCDTPPLEPAALTDPVNIAVSGGLDSWVLAALLKSRGHEIQGWYLETGIPGYCEKPIVEQLAAHLRVPCSYLRATAEDFHNALPGFVAVTEWPIYNLHPVSKLLFARQLASRGVAQIITGDGADQVMRHDWDCDLIPLTLACFEAAGIDLKTPFLSPQFIALCDRPTPDKEPLRRLAKKLGLPALPKRPTLFPPTDCLAESTNLLLKLCAESLV